MKTIVVSQRVNTLRGMYWDSIDHNMLSYLYSLRLHCVPIPNLAYSEDEYVQLLDKIEPDVVLLSGGNDIGEFPRRDFAETTLINYSINHNLPLIGICRGMQMIAHYFGVELKKVENHAGSKHAINGLMNGMVKSYHNYAINSCPDGFQVFAYAEDETIEGIAHVSKKILGIMWHPEREIPYRDQDIELISEFINESTHLSRWSWK